MVVMVITAHHSESYKDVIEPSNRISTCHMINAVLTINMLMVMRMYSMLYTNSRALLRNFATLFCNRRKRNRLTNRDSRIKRSDRNTGMTVITTNDQFLFSIANLLLATANFANNSK